MMERRDEESFIIPDRDVCRDLRTDLGLRRGQTQEEIAGFPGQVQDVRSRHFNPTGCLPMLLLDSRMDVHAELSGGAISNSGGEYRPGLFFEPDEPTLPGMQVLGIVFGDIRRRLSEYDPSVVTHGGGWQCMWDGG